MAHWKGSIAFGLVEIPVRLIPVEEPKGLSFAQLDRKDLSPVGYRRYNKSTGKEVEWKDIVRGFEFEKGQYAVLSDKDLERADPKGTRSLQILEFVDAEAIDPVLLDSPYYVVPQNANSRGYAILLETLAKARRAGIARVVLQTRERLGALLAHGPVLLLEMLRFQDEVRSPKDLEMPEQNRKSLRLTEAEIDMAKKLIEGMTVEWKPEKHVDRYREAVLKVVREKVKSGKTTEIDESEDGRAPRRAAEVLDLMPLLSKSVASTRKSSRGEGRKERTVAATRAPRTSRAGKTTGPPRAKRRSG